MPGRTALVALAAAALLAGCGGGGDTGRPATPNPSGAAPTTIGTPASTGSGATAAPGGSPTMTPFPTPNATPPPPLALTSSAFASGEPIPAAYTCRGADVSPALAWSHVPDGTGALVLLVDDPDAAGFVHWTVLDLAPTATSLPRSVSPSAAGVQQGVNDFGRIGYGGPCPPSGTHHYQFTLYALTHPLKLAGHPRGAAIRTALGTATVIAKVTLVGTVSH